MRPFAALLLLCVTTTQAQQPEKPKPQKPAKSNYQVGVPAFKPNYEQPAFDPAQVAPEFLPADAFHVPDDL